MVMRCKESFGTENLTVCNVLNDSPCDGEAIEGRGAAADLIQDKE